MDFLNQVALGVVIIWILLIIIFFVFLLRKYTFGKNWTVDNPNPYEKETLGMPRGVFRAVLTLSILFVVILLEVHSLSFPVEKLALNGEIFVPEDRFNRMMVAFQMMLAFYFGSKVMHHITSAESKTVKKKSDAAIEEASQSAPSAGQRTFEDEGALG